MSLSEMDWGGWTGREGSLSALEPLPRGPLVRPEEVAEMWVCPCRTLALVPISLETRSMCVCVWGGGVLVCAVNMRMCV